MTLATYFSQHPLFTTDELAAHFAARGSSNIWTRKSLIAHHEKQQRLLRIRRGLYAVVPPGVNPDEAPVDPYLVASKLSPDAVLAYHTALSFHGKAYSVLSRFDYLTVTAARPFTFRGNQFRPVLFPKRLRESGHEMFEVRVADRRGIEVRVTSLERAMVDVLDRPDLATGWEEIWRSLEAVEFYDLDRVVEYATLLGNATTIAKVGYFLEQHRDTLMVEETHLKRLRERRPKEAHYIAHREAPSRLVPAWNIIVPLAIIERTWEEPA